MINTVAIDPSLINTAVCINGKMFTFPSNNIAHTKGGELTKWFELCEPHVGYKFHSFEHTDKTYSELEIQKLTDYDSLAYSIVYTIKQNMHPKDDPFAVYDCPRVAIEGYSYSSAAGPLIDLVTFGTILRHRLLYDDYRFRPEIEIVSPTQLKSRAAAMTYPGETKGKKTIHRNKQGIAGGQFKKPDMYKAIIENDKFDDDWANFLRANAGDVLNYKSIPKPIEDLNDAYLLHKCMLEHV